MFQTFTGSSRRPRQVNLSGRNSNPFANTSLSSASVNNPQSSAVLHAQQERKVRQQERERLQASKVIQKVWKDYVVRKRRHQDQRAEWDTLMAQDHKDLRSMVRLLVQFAKPRQEVNDSQRIVQTCRTYMASDVQAVNKDDPEWAVDQVSFAEKLIEMLNIIVERSTFDDARPLILALQQICEDRVEQMALHSIELFKTMLQLVRSAREEWFLASNYNFFMILMRGAISRKVQAHKGVIALLEYSWLQDVLDLDYIAKAVDSGSLALALQDYLKTFRAKDAATTCWILAHYIYLYRKPTGPGSTTQLISSRAAHTNGNPQSDDKNSSEVIAHISSLTTLMSMMSRHQGIESRENDTEQLRSFVQAQLETLVDQETISSLLTHFEASGANNEQSEYASALASYALTLIQLFPRRSDEIRMWIYVGSTHTTVNGRTHRLPAIKFFWEAVKHTHIFKAISKDPDAVIKLLSPHSRRSIKKQAQASQEEEWKICLLFLELYTFVLKIMDDDEFMSAGVSNAGYDTWTRQSALHLDEVRDLIVFLKNLAFSMYWNASDITADEMAFESRNLRQYFSTTEIPHPTLNNSHNLDPLIVRGLQSSSLSYIKGTVTGLLRMLYERDSRRSFLPEGQWLMPQVEMTGFIQAVLGEQRNKDEHAEHDSEEEEDPMEVDDSEDRDLFSLVGSQRTQYIHRVEQIRKQQQRASRRRRLEDTLPRLNILENMPFFIPFHTRVQIFRQFVRADQELRRNGYIDPDSWRLSVMQSGRGDFESREQLLRSRSARVRRKHVMEDAFDQLYALGEGLKEPIQITFVDQFDVPEAGIDGGGVTKEFLTSVTDEAFKKGELKLFKENNQHLLYPNPALIEEEKIILGQADIPENSKEWHSHIREILSRYEFIGRVVGKCLYEGILIDVHFAPFFLVKWALTGGRGSATNESSYRATINDLRALDEELYKGLLDLKNYPGNVEDFSLDFTITDEISTEDEPLGSIKINKDLRPDGANIPVTNENKLVYISYVARHRLQIQPHQQTSAFLRGLGTMIQPSWLSMFNQSELQTLIGGDSSEIDVDDLRKNTLYGGVYQIGDDGEEHPTVKLFWKVVQELSDGDRRKLLKYVTSTPRAPLLGFNQLRPPFSIRDSGSDQQRLPSTSTCVNLLKLPIYKKKEVLREKLLYAISSGAGFDLS